MPLTGAWLEAARVPDPNQALVHAVNRDEHTDPTPDVRDAQNWQAPAYQAVEPAPSVVGNEWVTGAAGLLLPEPPPDHGYSPGHRTDDGSRDGRNRSDVRFQKSDESYRSDVFDGLGGEVSRVSDAALRRGKNAEAQNNPADTAYGGLGYRPGQVRQWNLWRNFKPPWRRHDQRIVSPWTATRIGDAPPPPNAGPRNSPYSSLARNIRRSRRPEMRRQPEPFDEAALSDGTDSTPVYMESWVVG